MTLPATPPVAASPVIRRGMAGWPAYAVQMGLRANGSHVTADGSFGPVTQAAVVTYQRDAHLAADGIVGPATQSSIVTSACRGIEQTMSLMPHGMMQGLCMGEGGLMLAPVNWGIAGGVDCGPVQQRVYGAPFSASAMRAAFSTDSIAAAAVLYRARRDGFLKAPWVAEQADKYQAAGRCAALAHNWPWGAEQVATAGGLPHPDAPAVWLPRDAHGQLYVRFHDGMLVRTMRDWTEFYALGGAHGPGLVTQYVSLWR